MAAMTSQRATTCLERRTVGPGRGAPTWRASEDLHTGHTSFSPNTHTYNVDDFHIGHYIRI